MIRLFFARVFHQNHALRYAFLVLGDIASVVCAVTFAFLLRFDGTIPHQYFQGAFEGIILLMLLVLIPVFVFSRLYSFSWSYVSTTDLLSLAKAVGAGFLLVGAAFFLSRESPLFIGFPRSVLFISAVFVFLFSGGIRFAKRIVEELTSSKSRKEGIRTLIVGAGDAGALLARNMMNASPYALVGFVDDNLSKKGNVIHGVRVLGSIENIPELVSAYHVEEMMIALPSAGSGPIKKSVEHGRNAGLSKIRIVPPLSEIINGEVSLKTLRDVQVEDLLGRDVVLLDLDPVERFIRGKNVLITGAAGSIGSELARQVSRFHPAALILLDQEETGIFHVERELREHVPDLALRASIADIRDRAKIELLFQEHHPDIVFHAAAYKHVPLMEANPDEAVKNNVFGTLALANTALAHETERFIFISTDKAVNPTSVMGATKRIGEMICQTFNQKNGTKFISVRFGNVLASRGSVISIFREQIKKGGPITVTHPEMKRYFMSASEACLLVLQAGSLGEGGEVFVLDMGSPVMIVELAAELIRLSGLEPDKDIPIVFTGMRPGEKLFEEILNTEEGAIPTTHQKIFRNQLAQVREEFLRDGLALLEDAVASSDRKTIVGALQNLVCNYQPRF